MKRFFNLRILLRVGAGILAVYALLSAGLFWAMKQSPLQFGRIMAKLPMVSMMVLPFEPLWNTARAGSLRPGDLAPDFRLQTQDKSTWVSLASFRGDRPVVLVFGSYT